MLSIETKNLTVRYGSRVALEDVSIEIEHPSLVVIMGPNGAGKTTFLKAILGLIPYQGEIRVLGKNPREVRHRIGYLPQRDTINTNVPLKVKEVLLLSLTSTKTVISKSDVEKARKALRMVGMEEHWNTRFDSLSGGQQQRVLFARALANNPDLLILDEPFSATDVKTKTSLIRLLHTLRDKTILMVLHDINPMVECTDKVIMLNKRLIAYGTVAEVINEENLEELYGTKIPVIKQGPVCYIVGGDRHA